MESNRFIELAKIFLMYSFREIDFEYKYLTNAEKNLISEEEFNLFVKKIKDETK